MKAIGRISVDGNTKKTEAYERQRDHNKEDIISGRIVQAIRQPCHGNTSGDCGRGVNYKGLIGVDSVASPGDLGTCKSRLRLY